MKEKLQLKQKLSRHNKLFIPFILILAVVIALVGYSFVAMQVEISQKNAELALLSEQREKIENENRQLCRYSEEDYKVEYIESIARNKLGYALPEERIYYIVPTD